MDITEIKKLIPFYVAGTLDKSEKEAVEEGLHKFPELSKEIEFWIHAGEATRAYVQLYQAGHLSVEQVVLYVEGKIQTDSAGIHKIENHLMVCDDCREDIEIIRNTYVTQDERPAKKQYEGPLKPWYRSTYAYVAAAVIIIGTILLLPNRLQESKNIVIPQNIYANLELPYRNVTRSVEPSEIPVLVLDSGVTHVRLTVYIPHTSIDSLSYNLSLLYPSKSELQIPNKYFPKPFDVSTDTVQVTLTRDHFSEKRGIYGLKLQEILPVSMSDLTPELHTYTFRIMPR